MVYYSPSFQSSKNKKGNAIGNVIIFVGIIALIGFYLVLNNSMVADNYRLNQLYQTIKEKEASNQNLQVQVDQNYSWPYIQKRAEEMGMVETRKPKYVKMDSLEKIVANK